MSIPAIGFGLIELFPFLIPIFGIAFGCTIAIVAILANYKKRRDMYELYHRERMAAIERGIDLPPLPEGFFNEDGARAPSPHRTLLRGLIWFLVGVALLFALPQMDEDLRLLGLVPMAVGGGYLLYYAFAGRKEAQLAEAAERARLAETNPPPRG